MTQFSNSLRYVPLVVAAAMLSACGFGNGRCSIPDTEAEVRRSLVLNLLRRMIDRENIVGITAEDYLAANPDCCSVEGRGLQVFEWLFWDRYSLPKYDVEVTVAWRRGATTSKYYSFGNGDSCGRIPDTFGEGDVLDGPAPPPSVSGVYDPPPATPVPIAEARRLIRLRYERERAERRAKYGESSGPARTS